PVQLHLPSPTRRSSDLDGVSLAEVGDIELDFALSYIVFQHIPDIEVIHGYIRQVAERLQPGALFKFQVQGSPAVETMDRDTWSGDRKSTRLNSSHVKIS